MENEEVGGWVDVSPFFASTFAFLRQYIYPGPLLSCLEQRGKQGGAKR